MLNGRLEQVIDPFIANVNLLDDYQAIGSFIPKYLTKK